MELKEMKEEVATDLIELVNDMKDFQFNAHVNYKLKSGGTTKFDYVTLDAILNKVKENKNFAISLPLGTNEAGESALQVMLIHKSGYILLSDYYELRVPKNGTKQDEGSAITYTKRYALGSFLGLCTDQDNDSNPDGEGMEVKEPKATEKQLDTVKMLVEDIDKMLEYLKIEKLEDMTKKQASEIIAKKMNSKEEK